MLNKIHKSPREALGEPLRFIFFTTTEGIRFTLKKFAFQYIVRNRQIRCDTRVLKNSNSEFSPSPAFKGMPAQTVLIEM